MVRAFQFIKEEEHIDSSAVNELDLFINNNEDLYRRQFMPKISKGKYKKEYTITTRRRRYGCT